MALRRASTPRRGSASRLVILGLANPGDEYAGSRHNVGGDTVRLVAQRHGVRLVLESRQRALSATFATGDGPVTLAVPTTFMNESGAAVPMLLKRTSLEDLTTLVVVHDELDLEPGRLQFKVGGGLAGHNGLRSIAQTLHTHDFARLRVGIGRPAHKGQVTDYVLRRLSGATRSAHETTVAAAADAIDDLISLGFEEAQRRINGPRD